MSNNNNGGELKVHINLVERELRTSSGARLIAGTIGIEAGVECPDALWDFCQQLIGYEANQEGYIDSYALDHEGYLKEPEEGQPLFGYGISISSHESYLALHEHFGRDWLEKSLTNSPEMNGTASKVLLEHARRNFDEASMRQRMVRLQEITGKVGALLKDLQQIKDLRGIAA